MKRTLLCVLVIALTSCKKLVDIAPPKTQLVSTNVFNDNRTANSAAISMFYLTASESYNIALNLGAASDELQSYNQSLNDFYNNTLTPTSNLSSLWAESYNIIYQANSIIDRLNTINGIDIKVKNQLIGEAKFIRAFYHFYLTRMFGDIPLALTSDYLITNSLKRSPSSTVMAQIISDLIDARSLLNSNYVGADGVSISTEKLRPNKATTVAFLAKVYLYTGDWVNAEIQSSSIIDGNQYSLSPLTGSTNVFSRNSSEAIWQTSLGSTSPYNTLEGQNFILTTTPSLCAISKQLLNSFESGDARKTSWTGNVTVGPDIFYFPFKYKISNSSSGISEYTMVLRLAEQYLIRAEARAQQNNFSGSQSDLNKIRNRAGLPNTNAGNKSDLLISIAHERQVELFTEWGDRWLFCGKSLCIGCSN